MAGRRRDQLTESLRRQLLTELRSGARRAGDRLPSARVVGRQLGADPRVVLAAYRALAAEGLVELRERSGVFVASGRARDAAADAHADDDSAPEPSSPSEAWLAELLAQAVSRALPAPELATWLARAAAPAEAPARLRAAVVAATADQVEGIRRELGDYYGVDTVGLPPGVPAPDAWMGGGAGKGIPTALRRADFIVTTEACAPPVRRLAGRLGKPFVSASVRSDLVGEEWRLLLRRPVYAIVTDARFATTMRHFFAGTPGVENLRAVVLGRDSLDAIPSDATVYVTQAARARLAATPLPGRVVPPARVFSAECAREIMAVIVRENLRRWREGVSGKRVSAKR